MRTLLNPADEFGGFPTYAINVGDTSPVPVGGDGSLAKSSTLNALVMWNGSGSNWQLASPSIPATTSRGTTSVNFGSGTKEASVVVTGQTSILSTSVPNATLLAADDSGWVDDIRLYITNIVAGVGFTIVAKPAMGVSFGTYNVGWTWF